MLGIVSSLFESFQVHAMTCFHEGMGLATLSHDMNSLSHDYCNMLIRLLVFRHNGLIKY
ncbi:Os09g0388000 [Oryza sativa Japonica Group]|uniref:Os09g0388000 protein n=2 Tax=Oryza TaxID=4527 RepID=Q6H582_ORYSJ|nr:hypothetical protein DAI22_09g086200 [Oryza sativa Japonica Group]BAD26061.1 unknown protein [Oryza sativa Japonica Group]BAD26117.1 unknown protein [Oryza sativa Japonica Group]BAF24993.1 Os09g0388000 [Oryza sativa Japonica Group]|eukprot:NP_001063079.1 Os09g0388000 [Oryza sativa Japonica Group]